QTQNTSVQPPVSTPQPSAQESPPPIDRTAYIEACNSARQAYADSYQIYVDQIRTRHESRLAAIHSDWASRGLANSGPAQAAKEGEKQRYQTELIAFELEYQHKFASYFCV